MPSKKRKYNARFPAGRIKKIMRLDNDIGKVALPVPVMISRALEIFVSNLLEKACNITMQKNARTLTLTHLKQSIYSDSRLDFLKELVKNIPDVSEECNDINFTEQSVKKKESITNSDSGEEELSSRPHFINVQSQMEGDVALQTIHSQLLNGCVCRLSIDAYYRLVSCPPHVASISDTIDNFSTARLLLSTRLQGRCPTIKRACSKLISDPSWLDYLLDNGLSSTNEYVRHAGVCVVSEAVFCCAINGKSRFRCLIDKLMVTILCKEHGTAAAAINVLARVLNGTDDEHPAKRNHLAAMHNYCTAEDKTETVESRPATSKNRGIKTLLLNHLHHYWTDVVYTVVHKARLSANSGQTSIALSELVQLWKSIVSALFDEKHYYSRYYSELPVLRYLLYRPDTDPYVWLNIVRLFGTSLKSIQCAGYETAVAMAKTIMIGLTVGQLLCFMQKILNAFGSDGWTTKVIQETVLLAMRSLRVFAVHGDADHGSTVTNVTLMVVHSLESYVKTALVEVNDVRVCQWLVRLMYDRDDAIVECLMCGLDIVDAVPGTMQELDPFESFCEFLMCISFEVDVILDYLISDEIDFLLYMLKILKMAASDFTCFRRNCRYKTKNTMELLIKLRLKILRLHNVFPYNITPIAKLIQQCDQLYIKHKLF